MVKDPKKPVLIVYLDETVSKGSVGYLEFRFDGTLETTTTEAFFKTTYTTENDVER